MSKSNGKPPEHYNYRVIWYEEDQEYVGLCREFPSLSYLDPHPLIALYGIKKLVEEILDEQERQTS